MVVKGFLVCNRRLLIFANVLLTASSSLFHLRYPETLKTFVHTLLLLFSCEETFKAQTHQTISKN